MHTVTKKSYSDNGGRFVLNNGYDQTKTLSLFTICLAY